MRKIRDTVISAYDFVINLGLYKFQNNSASRRVRLINAFSMFAMIVLTIYMPIFYYWGIGDLVWVSISQWMAYGLSLLFNYLRKFKVAKVIFISQLSLATMAFSSIMGEGVQLQLFYIPIINLSVVLFDSEQKLERFVTFVFPIVCFFTLEYVDYNILPRFILEPQLEKFMRWTIIVVILILNWIVISAFAKSSEVKEKKIHRLFDLSFADRLDFEHRELDKQIKEKG